MLTAVAFCPATPLLIRELNGRYDAAADLRAACHRALLQLGRVEAERLIVLGGATSTQRHSRPPEGGFAATTDDPQWSMRVAQRLLAEVSWHTPVRWQTLAHDAAPAESSRLGREIAEAPEPTAAVVLANGSACRTLAAPGYLDSRADSFDTQLVDALRRGDHQSLMELDSALATDLLVDGHATLRVIGVAAARTATQAMTVDLHYADAPFGVQYFVANWQFARTRSA